MKRFLYPFLIFIFAYYLKFHYRQPSIIIPHDKLFESYDYIIVGAGTAGGVIAARLAELPNVTVLVLEAGHDDYDFPDTQWIAREQELQYSDFDWGYRTVPQKNCCDGLVDKISKWPRGKGLGGCSSHNGAAHVRGSRFDYDFWDQEMGPNSGWSFDEVLPYFKKLEDVRNIDRLSGKPDWHEYDGPVTLIDRGLGPLAREMVDAAKSLGYKWLDDMNSMGGEDDQEVLGFCSVQRALKNGRRMSSAEAYLRPAVARYLDRLHILTHAHVTKLIFKPPHLSNRPSVGGVEYFHKGSHYQMAASREVIICGGAINSPQLLLLSGIGPKDDLEQLGIPVILDNKAVGQNMYDHMWVPLAATINDTSASFNGIDPQNWLELFLAKLQYYLSGTGPLTQSGIEFSSFLHSGVTNESWPDLQIYMSGGPVLDPPDVFNVNPEAMSALYPSPLVQGRKRIGLIVILLHPHNSGQIRLLSKSPFNHPLIDPKYLQNEIDVEILVQGLKIALKLLRSSEMVKYDLQMESRRIPGCQNFELWSNEYLRCYARNLLFTVYHPVSTCRMGRNGENSVVDTDLRVHGIDHLRIVDASIFPFQISANTNAPVLMVAEKASDLIKKAYFEN